MQLDAAIQDFMLYARHEQGYAKNSNKQRQAWLRQLLRWMTENGYPDPQVTDLTIPLLRRFVHHLSEKGLRPRSIRNGFYPIKSLGEFLVSSRLLTENPAAALTLPKLDAAERLEVTDEEVLKLLCGCTSLYPARRATLATALVYTLATTGVRRRELLNVHLSDLNLEERSILLRQTKNRKSHKVFLPDTTPIKEWLAVRGKADHDYLWTYYPNRRLGDNGLRELFNAVKAAAGLQDATHILPHGLRHNFGTRLLRAGADLKAVSAALNHSSVRITDIYLHAGEQRLREVSQLAAISLPPSASPPSTPAVYSPDLQEERETLRRQNRVRLITRSR